MALVAGALVHVVIDTTVGVVLNDPYLLDFLGHKARRAKPKVFQLGYNI